MQSISKKNQKWWALLAIGIMLYMLNVDFTATNLALAPIAAQFNANMSSIQWIINGFVVASAALMILAGKAGDIYGLKRSYLFGVILFTLASLWCGLASGEISLIIARIFQGAGVAFAFTLAMTILPQVFPENQQGFAIGCAMGIATFAQAIGPTFGGIILQFLGWRWIFLINVPVGIVACALTYFVLAKDKFKPETKSIHWFTSSLLIIGLFTLMTALNEIQQWGIISSPFLSVLFASIILLSAYYFLEKKTASPMIDFTIFNNANFVLANLARILFQFVFFAFLFLIGLYLQNILLLNSLQAGYLLLLMTVVSSLSSFASGKWIDRFGPHWLTISGFIILAIANFILPMVKMDASWTGYIIPLGFAGIGIGLLFSASTAVFYETIKPEQAGMATGIFFTNAILGGAIGVAISGWLLASFSSIHCLNALSALPWHKSISPNISLFLQQASSGTQPVNAIQNMVPTSNSGELILIAKQSFFSAWTYLNRIFSIILICGATCTFCILKNRNRQY